MKTFGKMVAGVRSGRDDGRPGVAAGPRRFRRRRFGGGGAMLLSNKGVQKELKVTDEQAKKLDTLAEEMQDQAARAVREAPGPLQGRAPREDAGAGRRIERRHCTRASPRSSSPSRSSGSTRSRLQQAGVNAFAMPRVQEELKLTDDQKSKIREINDEPASRSAKPSGAPATTARRP